MAVESIETEVDDEFKAKAEDEAEFRYLLIQAIVLELVTHHLPVSTVQRLLGNVEAEAACGFPTLDNRKAINVYSVVRSLFETEIAVLRARNAG